MIIKNGTIVTFNNKNDFLNNKAIYIKDGIIWDIDEIETIEKKYPDEIEIIDANGNFIMPGMICAHHHTYSAFARGMILDNCSPSNFTEVLEQLWWRVDKALSHEELYYSAKSTAIDCIKNGTTTIIDHNASPNCVEGSLDILAKGFSEMGVRGSYCYEVSERDGMEIAEKGLQENYKFIKKTKENKNSMISALFGIHAGFTVSDETLKKAVEMSNDLDTGFHIHVAEGKIDEEDSLKKYNKTILQRLNDIGVLRGDSIVVHAVYANKEDYKLLKENNTIVLHNPESNMNNGLDIPDITEMLNQDILVGLGTDGFTNNMFREIDTMYIAHKNYRHDPCAMSVPDTMKIAVKNNSEIVKRLFGKPAGIIEKGAFADIIIVDYNSPTPVTSDNFGGHMIFGLNSNNIISTIINGKLLMNNRQLIGIDENEILEKSREVAKKFWERV